tara:strand:+ start:1375 stop:3207 length:1833 start_codon:yes stop_codon:yes gene_type:complete
MKRYLVTTAIKETLPSPDRSILFLGRWCFDYSRKKEFEEFDHQTLEHPWREEKEFFNAYSYIRKLYPLVLGAIASQLNKFHCTAYSLRYWEILLGDWLKEFITILYERWMCIDSALSNYEISATSLLPVSLDNFVPNTYSCGQEWRRTDLWNYLIYLEILRELDVDKTIKFEPINHNENKLTYLKDTIIGMPSDKVESGFFYKNVKENSFRILNRILHRFSSDNSVFVIRSMMGRLNEIKLSLKLKQTPVIYQDIKKLILNDESVDQRDWIFSFGNRDNVFDSFLSRMITRFVPIIFLEKYKEFNAQVSSLGFPKSPKVICFSSPLQHEDLTKAYVAINVENKTELILIQHGGGYGIMKMDLNEDYEKRLADLFLTWGWISVENQNVIPFAVQKPAITKNSRRNSRQFDTKDILIIHHNFSRYFTTFTGNHYAPYFSDQLSSPYTFLDNLETNLLENVVIKLNGREHGWYYPLRYKDKYPSIKINLGTNTSPLDSFIRSKIVILTYNGTGLLETITLNIPSILLVDEICASFRDEAEDDFRNLKEIGVFHDDPLSAAKFLNDIYSDVDTWWNSKDVQSVLHTFKNKYCNYDPDYINKLANIISERKNMLL